MAMIEKTFTNNELAIELASYIDNKQNIWFKGKDIAKILRYADTNQTLRKHLDPEDKKQGPAKRRGFCSKHISSLNPVFTHSSLLPNLKQLKSSNIVQHQKCSHLSEKYG